MSGRVEEKGREGGKRERRVGMDEKRKSASNDGREMKRSGYGKESECRKSEGSEEERTRWERE